MKASPIALVGNFVTSILFTGAMWGRVAHTPLVLWLGLTWLVCGWVFVRWLDVRKRTFRRASRRTVIRSMLFAVLLALPWSWLSVYYMTAVSVQVDALLFGIVAGMSAGGGFLLSRVPPAALAYMATILIPSLAKGLASGQPFYATMVAFGVVYAIFLVVLVVHHAWVIFQRDASVASLEAQMDELTRARNNIAQLASSDSITGLANRHEFNRRLNPALDKADQGGRTVCLFLIDIDNFKSVNDTLGHTVGDEMLRILANRLTSVCSGAAVTARLGGDEFAVLLDMPADGENCAALAQRILKEMSLPVDLNGVHVTTGCSIGIAEFPGNARNPQELMSYADIALYTSKDNGRGIASQFDSDMKNRIRHDAEMERQLRHAVTENQLRLFYQPQFELATNKLVGFEALLRWNHPQRGMLTPEFFLHLADDKGLILDISDFVLQRARTDTGRWLNRGLDPGRVAINIHPTQLKQPEKLMAYLQDLAGDKVGERLILEITEGCVVGRGTERIPTLLRQIRDAGTLISLDDFGTGYASLTHLKELPVDEIKIDRQFTGDVLKAHGDGASPRAIIEMASALDIAIVAEGIETQEQAEKLAQIGCPVGQGFFYSKPVDWASATRFLTGGVWSTGIATGQREQAHCASPRFGVAG